MLGAKTCRFGFGITVLLSAAFCGAVLSAQTPEYRVEGPRLVYEYYIHTGDVLLISVYKHPELSRTVEVRANGDVNLPWADAMKVAGLRVQAASDLLRDKLPSDVVHRCLTITVKERTGLWVLENEPFFIDVPPPSHSYAKQTIDS